MPPARDRAWLLAKTDRWGTVIVRGSAKPGSARIGVTLALEVEYGEGC
jgi:hypothetical protein